MATSLELIVQIQDRELQSLRKDIRTLSREMGGVSTSARRASASYSTLNRSADKTSRSLTQATRGAIAGSGAFRGLGRAVAFSSAAFLGAAGLSNVIRGAIDELEEQGKVAAQTNTVIKSTGAVAGVTAGHVEALGKALLRKSGVDDEAIKSAENLLLAFTNVRDVTGQGNNVFTQATKATLDLSIAMHRDLNATALALGKALQDPIKGMTALRRVGVTFTAAQTATVKKLVESNKVLDAQKLILDEVRKRSEGAAKAYGNTLPGQIGKARESFRNLSASALKPLLPDISKAAQAAAEFFQKPSTEKQLREAVQTTADAFQEIAGAIGTAKDALGGWKNTIKLLIALKAASVISGWATQIGLFGDAIGPAGGDGALGRSTKLRASLTSLKRIGAITIGLELIFDDSAKKKVEGFLRKHGIDLDLDKGLIQIFDHKGKPFSQTPFFGGRIPPQAPGAKLKTGKGGTTPAMSAVFPGASKGLGVARKAGGADRAGVRTKAHVITFVRRIAAIFGGPLTIGTGTNHNQFVVGTNHESDHWTGNAADIPATGATLTRLGQCALIAAGMSPNEASKQSGGVFNVNGVNILFNTLVGGNHFNHCHVGLHSLPSGFNTGFGSATTVQPSSSSSTRDGAAPPQAHNAPAKPTVAALFKTPKGLSVRGALAAAHGTKDKGDDIKALNAEEDFLREALKSAKRGTVYRTQILEEIGAVQARIRAKQGKPRAEASELLPRSIRTQIAVAEGTLKNTKDDIAAWQRALAFLIKLRGTVKKGSEKFIEVQQEITGAKQTIAGLRAPKKDTGELVPLKLRLGLANAEGTKSLQDDLKALRNIQTFLRSALKGTKGEKRLPILDELTSVKDRIGGIVRDILENAKSAVEKQRGKLGDAFGKVADSMLSAFDEKTSQLSDALSATFDALTPSELELLGIETKQRGRERVDLVAEVDRTRRRLDRATGRRRGKAQREFDEASEALRSFDLEPLAEAERTAAEKRREVALGALAKQRADERQALEDKIEAFKTMLETGGLTLGSSFAKGLVAAFPEFKKAVDAYFDYLRQHGLPGAPAAGARPTGANAGFDPAIATAIRGSGSRTLSSAPAAAQPFVVVPVVIASDLAEATAKYNRRNGRQL